MDKKKIKKLIEEKIKKNFSDATFSVSDTSYKHKNHKQNVFNNESHFFINVKTKKFSHISRIQRQRIFLKILGSKIIDNVHSISMKLVAPDD